MGVIGYHYSTMPDEKLNEKLYGKISKNIT